MTIHRPLLWRIQFWRAFLNFRLVLFYVHHAHQAYRDKHFDQVVQFRLIVATRVNSTVPEGEHVPHDTKRNKWRKQEKKKKKIKTNK